VGPRFSAPVPTGLGARPVSYTVRTEAFPGVKRPGRAVDHPPLLDPGLKKSRCISPLPLLAFVACSRVTFLHLFYTQNRGQKLSLFKMKVHF
jgi:hypothetical protein